MLGTETEEPTAPTARPLLGSCAFRGTPSGIRGEAAATPRFSIAALRARLRRGQRHAVTIAVDEMLDIILRSLPISGANTGLRSELREHVDRTARLGRGDRRLVAMAERVVSSNPGSAFTFDDNGFATLSAAGHRWHAGRFETVSLATLRERALALQSDPATRARLHVLLGASPLTDIGAMQATAGEGTLFQAASQFNCLEAPGPFRIARVSEYFDDPTQGPRASISAFPATLLRHYMAPDEEGGHFVQLTDGKQIDLLAKACGRRVCRNGYLTGEGIDPQQLADALQSSFASIEVGVHTGAEVVLGANWDGAVDGCRRIAQVFTSTVAGGMYGADRVLGPAFASVSRQLLRAAYLGTLLAATSLGCTRVVLTLVGGGVFANPIATIWESILWASDEVEPMLPRDLDVFVNGHDRLDAAAVLPPVRARGGTVLEFDRDGLREISR